MLKCTASQVVTDCCPVSNWLESLIGRSALKASCYHPSTLANSTLIILFSEMLKISKTISSKSKNIYIVKKNSEYFRNIPCVEMKISKLIN
jgi:hypothetical protein